MSEGFDANVDCITGLGITPEDMLNFSRRQPFDGRAGDEEYVWWAQWAADAALKDLSWRNGISQDLKAMDFETRQAIVRRIADIIDKASKLEGPDKSIEDICKMHNWSREDFQKREDEVLDALALARQHLEALKAHLTRDFSGVSDAQIKATAEAGWLPKELAFDPVGKIKELQEKVAKGERTRQEVIEEFGREQFGAEAGTATRISLFDLPETVAQFTRITEERDEAVSRADVADYTRDAIVARCKDLEAQMTVEGRVLGETLEAPLPWKPYHVIVDDESFLLGILPKELDRLKAALEAHAESEAA